MLGFNPNPCGTRHLNANDTPEVATCHLLPTASAPATTVSQGVASIPLHAYSAADAEYSDSPPPNPTARPSLPRQGKTGVGVLISTLLALTRPSVADRGVPGRQARPWPARHQSSVWVWQVCQPCMSCWLGAGKTAKVVEIGTVTFHQV